MGHSRTSIATGSLLVRATYFADVEPDTPLTPTEPGEAPSLVRELEENFARPDRWQRSPDAPDLEAAAAALTQTHCYFRAAWLLTAGEWPGVLRERRPTVTLEITDIPGVELVAVEMRSPLVITLALPAIYLSKYGRGLVDLATRICTLKPRVARERKEELLAKEALDRAQELLRSGRADALALQVLNAGPGAPFARGPSRVDFLDPGASDEDDLEILDEPALG
jgi:hypothetical protein